MDNKNQELEDFEYLKKLLNNEIKIEDLSLDLKKRLIILCSNQSSLLDQKIEADIKELKEMMELLKQYNENNQ